MIPAAVVGTATAPIAEVDGARVGAANAPAPVVVTNADDPPPANKSKEKGPGRPGPFTRFAQVQYHRQ